MAEKILVFNAKSCTVVDQYINCTWVCLDLFWGCYGAICTEQSALLVNGPSEVQELQAILMVPNVALISYFSSTIPQISVGENIGIGG